MITLCKIDLEHVVEQVHGGAAHVNRDWVEEEDGVVLRHTENISVMDLKVKEEEKKKGVTFFGLDWTYDRGKRWRSSRSHWKYFCH